MPAPDRLTTSFASCARLSAMSDDDLPLFPLPTVLVPGAALGLRVFEPRYLDLVSECGRKGSGFGICLLMDGDEGEQTSAAAAAAFGTEALIEDFDTDDFDACNGVFGRACIIQSIFLNGLVIAFAASPELRPCIKRHA